MKCSSCERFASPPSSLYSCIASSFQSHTIALFTSGWRDLVRSDARGQCHCCFHTQLNRLSVYVHVPFRLTKCGFRQYKSLHFRVKSYFKIWSVYMLFLLVRSLPTRLFGSGWQTAPDFMVHSSFKLPRMFTSVQPVNLSMDTRLYQIHLISLYLWKLVGFRQPSFPAKTSLLENVYVCVIHSSITINTWMEHKIRGSVFWSGSFLLPKTWRQAKVCFHFTGEHHVHKFPQLSH